MQPYHIGGGLSGVWVRSTMGQIDREPARALQKARMPVIDGALETTNAVKEDQQQLVAG